MGVDEAERRGLYLGPGNWIQWMTLAELQERVRHADNPKKYALSLWKTGKKSMWHCPLNSGTGRCVVTLMRRTIRDLTVNG